MLKTSITAKKFIFLITIDPFIFPDEGDTETDFPARLVCFDRRNQNDIFKISESFTNF